MRISKLIILYYFLNNDSQVHSHNLSRGGFRGGTRPGHPIFTCKNFLEPYICPYANTCLKTSSCIDLKCLLYVCATVKIQFANTFLNHTHPPLGCHAFLHVRPPYSKILDPPLLTSQNVLVGYLI